MTNPTTPASGETDHHTPSTQPTEIERAAQKFIGAYNPKCHFFEESFLKKIKQGNRKALSELERDPLPPAQMDLRKELADCVKVNVPDDYLFTMNDGATYRMKELNQLVPEWYSTARNALIASDPAWADKLMTPAQWNAKSAFEVTFINAINELNQIKKSKHSAPATQEHYTRWTINPLKKAIEEVNVVKTPGNALVGYGDRISLSEALKMAEKLENEFHKALRGKR
jgi:hypothetical protein